MENKQETTEKIKHALKMITKIQMDSSRAMGGLWMDIQKLVKELGDFERCQTINCKRKATVTCREGFHLIRLCKPCANGKEIYHGGKV